MQVNDALVDNLAELACLEFNPIEKEAIKQDLQKMVSFVEKLNELDTSGVAPLLQMCSHADVLRADEINQSITREAALANAPDADQSFFKVPKVIRNPSSAENW